MARASRGGGVWAAPGYSAEMYSPYGPHGKELRAHFGYRGHGGQLGKQSGLYPGGKLEGGNAAIHVRFENPPKGMRSKIAASSGFKEVKMSRGPTIKAQES
jgi:hypothetical protein